MLNKKMKFVFAIVCALCMCNYSPYVVASDKIVVSKDGKAVVKNKTYLFDKIKAKFSRKQPPPTKHVKEVESSYKYHSKLSAVTYGVIGHSELIAKPLLVGTNLLCVLGKNGVLSLYDLEKKQKVWDRSVIMNDDSISFANVMFKDDKFYISYNRDLVVLNKDGFEVVRKDFNATILSMKHYNDNILIQFLNGSLVLLNVNSWTILKKVDIESNGVRYSDNSTMLLGDGFLLYPVASGELVKISLSEFQPMWKVSLNKYIVDNGLNAFVSKDFDMKTIMSKSGIYVKTYETPLLKLSHADGSVIWQLPINHVSSASVYVMNGDVEILYVTTPDRKLLAVDASNGKILWQNSLKLKMKAIYEDEVFFLPPVIHNGVLYVFSKEFAVYLCDPETGEKFDGKKLVGNSLSYEKNLSYLFDWENRFMFFDSNKLMMLNQ